MTLRRFCSFLFALFAVLVLATTLASAQTTITPSFDSGDTLEIADYVSVYGDYAIQFVFQHAGLFIPLGAKMFALTALWSLCGIGIRAILRNIGHHHVIHDVEAFMFWFFRLLFGVTLLQFWATPLIGDASLASVIPMFFKGIGEAVDVKIVAEFFAVVLNAFHKTHMPGLTEVFFIWVYWLAIGSLFMMCGLVFAIESIAYFGMAVFGVAGPLTFWSIMTVTQGRRFWTIIDNLIVFGSYRLVSSVAMYLYCHSIVDFFHDAFANGNYGMGHWLELLAPVMMYAIGMIWAIFSVPKIAASLCGGTSVGAMGEAYFASAKSVVSMALRQAVAAAA